MDDIAVIDVILPPPFVVDVIEMAGTPGPPGIAGPHAATHQSGGADPITGSLALTSGTLSIGPTPAQSGALRLGNGAEIRARNAANSADIPALVVDANNDVIVGSVAGNNSQMHGGTQVSLIAGANTIAVAGSYLTPVADGSISLGLASNRWSACHVATSVAVGTTPAQSGALRLGNNQAITARNAANNGDVSIVTVGGGSEVNIGQGAAYVAMTSTLYLSGMVQMQECTAPAAPSANQVNIWTEDNGSGKTRLMARFATGAAIQIAIEP